MLHRLLPEKVVALVSGLLDDTIGQPAGFVTAT